MHHHIVSTFRRPRLARASLATALLMTAAACGSSADSNAGGGTTDPAFLADAKAAYTEATTIPSTWQGPTEPVKVAKNLDVTLIQCDARLSGCVAPLDEIEKVGQKYGWSSKTQDAGSDPAKANQQIVSAVDSGSDVIFVVGLDPLLIQQGLAAADKAGIPVILGEGGTSSPNPVVDPEGKPWVTVDVAPPYPAMGQAAANYIITDSDGKGSALLVTSKELRGTALHIDAAAARLKECAGCTSETINVSPANVGTTVADDIVAYVRSHPEVGYIYVGYDPIAAVAIPALQKAGMAGRVKVIGILGSAQNVQMTREGLQAGDMAFDLRYTGYAMVDQAFRALAGVELSEPNGENVPWYFLTKENPPEGDTWFAPFDYIGEYSKIWTS